MRYISLLVLFVGALCQGSCKESSDGAEKGAPKVEIQEDPGLVDKIRARNLNKASLHLQQIFLAVLEFENDQGLRPGEMVAKEGNVAGAMAGTANECFRQLFQGLASVRDEDIFHTPSALSKAPDRDVGDPSNHFKQACEKGEVAFLYVDNPSSKTGAPLAAAPLLDRNGRFDSEVYGGKAAVLFTDGTVQQLEINPETGKVEIEVKGKLVDLFSVDNPHFRNAPNIKYPEPK